jgi:ureidoglycolate lyase
MANILRAMPRMATPESIAPFGTLIEPGEDGAPFGAGDAELDLTQGTPRFYIMRLRHRPLVIRGITRHSRVTQCLASMKGEEWFIGLAEADGDPTPDEIKVFRIGGDVALALHAGTWHAGPFFTAPSVDFLNLELADTNETDHDTVRIDQAYGTAIEIMA